MASTVILVRHTAVARRWQGRCYGRSDVGLGRDGLARLGPLALALAAQRPDWVVHSDLRRTRQLAERIAKLARCPMFADAGWQERDFGSWEGRSWQAIYRASGRAMDGMIDAPDDFRPGGGETTLELAERSIAAWRRLPSGSGIVVSHGGAIAALLGQQRGLPPRDWLGLVPAPGEMHVVERA